MKVAVFSTQPYDRRFLEKENTGHELTFFEPRMGPDTALLAEGHAAVCCFVNDDLSAPVLRQLYAGGTTFIALRCAGFNQVDLEVARELGIKVARVPAYSPNAVAEHTVALILALNRKIHRAYNRVRESNFSLEGLLGFDLHGRTVGLIGQGKIGRIVGDIMRGFGCRVLAHDPFLEDSTPLDELLPQSDVVSLHCPLTKDTYHLINEETLAKLKKGAMLINTSRGGLVDARAAIRALKSGHLGSLGLDVYEEEAELFFQDRSGEVVGDDLFARLTTFPNVLITGHQAFFTEEALTAIARTTFENLDKGTNLL